MRLVQAEEFQISFKIGKAFLQHSDVQKVIPGKRKVMERPIVFEFQVLGAQLFNICIPLEFADELFARFVPWFEGPSWQRYVLWHLRKNVLEQPTSLLAHTLLPNVRISTISETSCSWSSYDSPSSDPQPSSN